MFSDIEKNKEMILGAYKKLKSYYHYNKNFVFMKKKIAEFEYDSQFMEKRIDLLARILSKRGLKNANKMMKEWLDEISFYVLPKSFKKSENKNPLFVSENYNENLPVDKVNFFIDMSIELHILETLWTVLVGKLLFEHKAISDDSYGNSIDNYVLYNGQKDFISSINFSKNKLFKIYYPEYCKWKNGAVRTVEENYKNQKSQLLFSIDIKGFYYSVFWKFSLLDNLLDDDDKYGELQFLTEIVREIFKKYTYVVSEFRLIGQKPENEEYVLPIGLFSSMVLANVYMARFDETLRKTDKVLYYGRYVDDIIIVLDVTGDEKSIDENTVFEEYLLARSHLLVKQKEKYALNNYNTLYIQKEKTKIFYFRKSESKALVNRLKKLEIHPSQMNVIPDTELNLVDFEEAAYLSNGVGEETKLRDIGQMEIDRFQLGSHMSQIVMNNRSKKSFLTKEEKVLRQNEGDSILKFFQGSKALDYFSNWINALYYFLLTKETRRNGWKLFEHNVRSAIDNLVLGDNKELVGRKKKSIKKNMKENLHLFFDICISTALALNPLYSKQEKKADIELAYKIRQANLFNHHLVSIPLINYVDNLNENLNLTSVTLDQLKDLDVFIRHSRKTKLNPRFINLEEIYHFVFLLHSTNGGYYFANLKSESGFKNDDGQKKESVSKTQYIEEYFLDANQIYKRAEKIINVKIENKDAYGYVLQYVDLGGEALRKQELRIAIANIKLDIKRWSLGLNVRDDIELNRLDLITFMKTAFAGGVGKADFMVFPEFYMPLQWIADVLTFVRKSGITIISGLQYITKDHQAFNYVALFAPIQSGNYTSAILLAREKNDYAPVERQGLAAEHYICKDQEKPIYQLIKRKGISYGIFLCYEFTDIVARSIFQNKVDVLFAPEYNPDTAYFSSIIESTARDLHTFIVQANTSIYGDSRITGPYSKNDRNIVQIKGGDKDSIVVGTIEIGKVRDYQCKVKEEFERTVSALMVDKKKAEDYKVKMYAESTLEISKPSARFKAHD